MESSTVYSASGLLPVLLEEITLAPDEHLGWTVVFVRSDVTHHAQLDFGGGSDPRAWLAFALASDFHFEEPAALEVSRLLFAPFLPPVVDDSNASPYGMPTT